MYSEIRTHSSLSEVSYVSMCAPSYSVDRGTTLSPSSPDHRTICVVIVVCLLSGCDGAKKMPQMMKRSMMVPQPIEPQPISSSVFFLASVMILSSVGWLVVVSGTSLGQTDPLGRYNQIGAKSATARSLTIEVNQPDGISAR